MGKGHVQVPRLTPFLRGVIYGLFVAGWAYQEIANEVEKADGTNPCQQSVAATIAAVRKNGGMQCDGMSGSSTSAEVGRPLKTNPGLDKQILKLVFKHRGRARVTVPYVQRKIPAAKKVSRRTIARRLRDAGLAWLRRRRKSLVPEVHKAFRVQWANWVLKRTAVSLARWAYTDGTVFYLARDATEKQNTLRGGLGAYVWRQADGSDALYEDCVGPSAYWKGQGAAVRIWGLLLAGMLFVYVLPEGEPMNRWLYEWLIRTMFPRWIAKAFHGKTRISLVQDHEKSLWTAGPREAMRSQGITLLENCPKCSQDLNPIEIAWREVRARLDLLQLQGSGPSEQASRLHARDLLPAAGTLPRWPKQEIEKAYDKSG